VELVGPQHIAIVGYGNIGSAIAKIAKNGFGMKVTGVKRLQDPTTEEARSYCDELVGPEEYERVVSEADYVVGILPRTPATDDFFTMESTFGKMKPTAVFMNIGRGSCVKEEDLVQALNTDKISGAVLDVYKQEPLPAESDLWDAKNLLMYPHCADVDAGNTYMDRNMQLLLQNIELFATSGTKNLINVCDKK